MALASAFERINLELKFSTNLKIAALKGAIVDFEELWSQLGDVIIGPWRSNKEVGHRIHFIQKALNRISSATRAPEVSISPEGRVTITVSKCPEELRKCLETQNRFFLEISR